MSQDHSKMCTPQTKPHSRVYTSSDDISQLLIVLLRLNILLIFKTE